MPSIVNLRDDIKKYLTAFLPYFFTMSLAEIMFPNKKYTFHAFIAGIFAVSLDLFIDPMMVNYGAASMFSDSEGMWVWLSDPSNTFRIFSIPFFNFLGWFFVIFGFSLLYGYILNDQKINERGKKNSSLYFIVGIPLIVIGIFFIILIINYIIQPFLGGINLIPIG